MLIYVRDCWHQDISEVELCGLFYLLASLIVSGNLDIPQTLIPGKRNEKSELTGLDKCWLWQ